MIEINGRSFLGSNINIVGGKVIVDGKEVDGLQDEKEINIVVNGDIKTLQSGNGNVSVTGSVDSVQTVNGEIKITGSVGNSVKTVNGDVHCGEVHGSVNSVNGDIKTRKENESSKKVVDR